MKRNSVFVIALLAALGACLPKADTSGDPATPAGAPGGGGGTAIAECPIKIGVAGPRTGPQAKSGLDLDLGTEMAIAEWNAKGGALGCDIERIMKDDRSEETEARTVANALIADGVVGVIGHFNSGVTYPASEAYAEAYIPMITPASTNPNITDRAYREGWTTVFRLCGRDDDQGPIAAEFAMAQGLTRMAIFHDKTTYGEGLAMAFRDRAQELGAEIIQFSGFAKEDTDFRPHFTPILNKQVDVLYFGGIFNQAGPMVRQLREMGITATYMSGDGVIYQEFLDMAGDDAEGSLLTFPNVYSTAAGVAFKDAYLERFADRGITEAGPYAIFSYVATNLLLQAMVDAGTTEGLAVSKQLRAEEVQTPLGKVKFNERGDVSESLYVVWVVKDGEFVPWDEAN
ncbi:branched-chain amino acid ABC transporter substrate-binding protein [bacterium]|nr:branched-chain amino acid ABC transporter substrate-binding protein [bacterium]